jgi:hypothetical protein
MSDKPNKSELPNELRRILNTLTDDAQNTAVKKFSETGLDPDKGKIPLQETLINLGQTRDILLDSIETGKFVQLPLKIQYVLFDQVQATARELDELAAGKDAVLNLENAVEDLTASAWQFQLHNLSGEVLGFQTKMNQLKAQETRIRDVGRKADEFTSLHDRAKQAADEIAEHSSAITSEHDAATKVTAQLQAVLKEATDLSQKISGLAAQVEQYDTSAGQQLAIAKQSAADTEAIAAKSKEMRAEIEAARTALQELTTNTQQLITHTETTTTNKLTEFEAAFEKLRGTAETRTNELTSRLDQSIADITAQSTTKIETLTGSADERVTKLVTDSSTRMAHAEATHDTALAERLKEFGTKGEAAVQAFAEKGEQSVAAGNADLKRLVDELNELEGRIRTAIERATGFTLFHAFQERQLQVIKNKNFWAGALAVCVLLAIGAAGWFIYLYRDLQQVTPAFFLKLSISIPLVYAIAFCNLQYSRERKLEEEYAFKSSVSISLDPYQRLVGSLVDHNNKEELAKYTEFIIQSVNRVFTSPMEPIFEGSRRERTYAEKIIKAVGGAIGTATEPLVKGLKRN